MNKNFDICCNDTYTVHMEDQNLPVPLIDDAYDSLKNVRADNVIEPTERDIEIIEEMAAIGCTPREICGVLGFTPETLKNLSQAKSAMLRGHERAKVSLRRLQWKTAQKNPVMQIFLGKQLLGQADKLEQKDDSTETDRARKAFSDKLKNFIDITPTRPPDGKPKRSRKGKRSEVPVVVVGEGRSTTTEGELA